MKPPLSFGATFFFRVVLPGLFLALGILPIVRALVEELSVSNHFEVIFGFVVLAAGWIFSVCDLPIYMLYEGRRYWPNAVRKYFTGREQRRLANLEATMLRHEQDDSPEGEAKYLEAAFDIREFPLDSEGRSKVIYPTRLGNLIEGYELYSDSRYGLDAVFYWPRIWLSMEKEVRDEVQVQQAMADSPVYVSAALLASGVLWLVFALAYFLEPLPLFALQEISRSLTEVLPGPSARVGLSGLFFLGSYWTYRLSVPAHLQYGQTFKAAVDRSAWKLSQMVPLSLIAAHFPTDLQFPCETDPPLSERFEAVRRYLDYRRVKCPRCATTVSVNSWRDHSCKDS